METMGRGEGRRMGEGKVKEHKREMEKEKGRKTLLLIGGGHAHVQVVPEIGPSEDVKPVMIADAISAYYSGMIPSHVAGAYTDDQCKVNLPVLCRHFGWEFVQGKVFDIDAASKCVHYEDPSGHRLKLHYDVASIDVGSCTRDPFRTPVPDSQHVVFTRPISQLNTKIDASLALFKETHAANSAPNIVVVGAGAAGVELAFAITQHARIVTGTRPNVTLVSRSPSILKAYHKSTIRKTMATLRSKGVNVELSRAIVEYREADGVVLDDQDNTLPADLVIVASGAAPHAWVANVALPQDDRGFIRVTDTLQVVGFRHLFAVGDCLSLDTYQGKFPPKAGVYAVREGPILCHNLKAVLASDSPTLKKYHPQSDFLSLLITGNGAAIGTKWGITMKGRWVWRLKDHIDRSWMAQFEVEHDESQQPANTASPDKQPEQLAFDQHSDGDVNTVHKRRIPATSGHNSSSCGTRTTLAIALAALVLAVLLTYAADPRPE